MTKEQIYTILDEMLGNPKAKTFLNHLVRSYLPISNVKKVVETPKGEFKCVLTKKSLVCDQEINKASNSEEFQLLLKNSMGNSVEEKNADALNSIVGDRERGVTGNNTTTFMSESGYEAFSEWIVNKSLSADKHVNWLLGSIRRESLVSNIKGYEQYDAKQKIDKSRTKSNGATFSLSDSSDVLAKLKAELEAKGK